MAGFWERVVLILLARPNKKYTYKSLETKLDVCVHNYVFLAYKLFSKSCLEAPYLQHPRHLHLPVVIPLWKR